MSDSEGSSSDFELVSHDSLAASTAHPSTNGGAQLEGSGTSANMDRSGFGGTLRLVGQDAPRPAGTSITTRRSLHTPHLTHSQHAQSPPVTDSEYDALSESSMDEVHHGHDDDSAELERAIRLFTSGQPSATAQQDLVPASSLHHLSSSSASESSLSLDLHASGSSLSHSTVSTTTSDETDDDEAEGGGAQLDHQAQGHHHQEPRLMQQQPQTATAAPGAAVNFMDHGDPFPSTFPMSVAHLPTFTLTQANNEGTGGGRHDFQQQEQFILPGAETDTDTDTDDDCPLIDQITNATGHQGFNHDLVMRSRLVHHGVAASTPASASDSLGHDDFEELTRLLSSDAQDTQDTDLDAQLDSVIDVTPHQSHLGTLANVSAADLPDMLPALRVSDAPAPAAAAGETHVRDAAAATGAADPNGLMQLLSELEAAAGPPAEPDAPPPAPRSTVRKSAPAPRSPSTSVHFDLSPPSSPAAAQTDPVFASDTSLHLVSGGSPCPCPSCDLRPGGPGWSLFRTLGPRKYPTASMRKYADAHATQRMHARVRRASVVSARLAHAVTLAVGVLIGWLATTWWVQAGMLAAYQKEVRGLHAQLALGAAHVQGTRVAVNQVHARVAAQGTWIKAEVYEARMQVKQLASVLQAYQRAVVEGGGRGRGVVERFGELMKRADEFLGRVGGMHGFPDGELGKDKVDEEKAQDKVQEEEAIVVEDVIVTEPDAVPTTAEEMPKPFVEPDVTHHQAPPNIADEAGTDTPQPETKHDSTDTPADDHAQAQDDDDPHAVAESPMSMIARSIVHVVRRIGKSTRKAVLATARALDRMCMEMVEWRASAKAKLQWWLEESRAAKARRARAVPAPAQAPADQTQADAEVKLEDRPTPPTEQVQDSGNPSTSPAGSAAVSGDAVHATMLREKLRQAQEFLRSVERQEPEEGRVIDKWERIQWANRMSAAKDTVRVAREDMERQLGTAGADRV